MEDKLSQLKLYSQLYESSKQKTNEGLDKLKKRMENYDINPDLNYRIMKKMLDKKKFTAEDINDFYQFYINYNQTLFYGQKLDIIDELSKKKNSKIQNKITEKINLNELSFIDGYFDIIKELCSVSSKLYLNKKINYDNIINLFHNTYFVDNYEINTPLIYGTYELIFSGLIYSLYFNLLYKENEDEIAPSKVGTLSDYASYPKNIMTKKSKNEINRDNDVNADNDSNYSSMDIDESGEESSEESFKINKSDFNSKIKFISPFLRKIASNDFKEILGLDKIKEENQSNIYEPKPKVNALIFHLLYIELIFYIYSHFSSNKFLQDFDDLFFFETKEEKLEFFTAMNEKENEVIIVDENDKQVTRKKDIANKNYIIYNAKNINEKFIFNPYDFILSKFTSAKDFSDLVKKFSRIESFSLFKFYKENSLFNNDELNSAFKNNIKEMLSSKTISELFDQYVSFNSYFCPYIGDEKENFVSQTFDIIYYFPIPYADIFGFTYKQFGLIFISNINRFDKIIYNDKKQAKKELCFQINKISFLKIVHVHEIICHYSCAIIHSNDKEVPIATPEKTFIGFKPMKKYTYLTENYDGGDKGESILFGNKIKYIYTKGALFILNNNNYKKDLKNFKEKFMVMNNYKGGDTLNLNAESSNNELIGEIIVQFFGEGEIPIKTIKLEKNHISCFRIGSSSNNNNLLNEYYEIGLSYFESVTHIFPNYRKILK